HWDSTATSRRRRPRTARRRTCRMPTSSGRCCPNSKGPAIDMNVTDGAPPDTNALRRALAAIQDLRARLEVAEAGRHEPIAIIGAGCHFPKADGPDEYWDLLDAGEMTVADVPPERWNAAEH